MMSNLFLSDPFSDHKYDIIFICDSVQADLGKANNTLCLYTCSLVLSQSVIGAGGGGGEG
jgi:hypothetical protein